MPLPDASRPNSAREKHDTETVAVGIRVRPLLPKDIAEGSRECLRKVPDEPQVVLGLDRAFTFDHVFEATAPQDRVYAECMDPLMKSVLSGHNATVLAYGQTGSGKTHTMGSSATSAEAALQSPHNDSGLFHESVGLIPRALHQLFLAITDRPGVKCTAKASFIEIYKEEVLDLLSWTTESDQLATLPIREENGIVSLTGLRQRKVSSVAEAMNVLTEGARSRSTGATAMNATSSRSHAIFTLSLELTSSGKTVSPKVNFVDLAGSERAKRTGASGERLQEGIQINKGLLALGNVINSLCERQSHVPYRDSKLTRLLQDSLGGNSRTLMLACVSPADADLEETLNTLKYANRARQIRNKPLVVQDPVQAQLSELQELVSQLQIRLAHYEGGGSALPSLSGSETIVPAAQADSLLMKRVSQLEAENEALRRRLTSLVKTGGRAALTDQSNQPAVQDVLARESSPLANVPENGLCALSHDESFSKQTSAEEDALAEEQLEEELEFQRQQGGLSEQLQGLDETLALKQALLKSQGGDKEEVAALQSQLNQLEAELHGLSKERETLITQVETLRKKSASGDEESRMAKKLEMVEAELQRLRAQQSKQASLLRARQASERRVKELENEIETIKANKVALMRRQREEAELHRLQKRERENELRMLRRKEEKTNAQLLKLEEEHAKQAIVLKRKSEEIIAQQKRLRMHENVAAGGAKPRVSVGASRSSCTPRVPPSTAAQVAKLENKRTEEMGRAGDPIYSKPREWLAGEIDAVMLVKDLQAQIQTQIAQRRATQLKLNALEEHHKQAGKEMSDLQSMATSDADVEAVCSEAAAARQAEVEALRMKVEHHNTELQKLQSRLLRCETDEKKTLTKIESLSNINHSKAVLKHAIPQLVQLRVAAKRSEQILAVKVSAMNTQQELISALQAEVEKQRKQGAAEQLQLMEQLQQLQQELDAVRAAPVEKSGNLASRTLTTESEAATAAMLDKRLQALKKAAAAPNVPAAVRDEPESEQQESENESEEDIEESDDDDASDSSDVDWLASEDAKAQLPRSILSQQSINAGSGLADATLDGDAPLPLRKARRTTATSKQLVHLESEKNERVGSGLQNAREAVKQQSAALTMVRGERPRAESDKTSEKAANKSDSMRMEKSNKGDEIPVAKVDLSKAMVESEKRKALGSLDSNSLEKQRGRSKRDDEPPLKEPTKRKLYNASNTTVVREAF